ncbi:MAG: TonB-dependent receptor [Alphaproteobacteria bacterium]|nr:TonB-dependent receptor [Alphaproteobacteria bacterium]
MVTKLLNSTSLRALLLAGAASMLTSAALAQDTPAPADETVEESVTVTGSRIKRTEFTAESPITVIDAKAIATAGQLNLGQVLREELAISNTDGFNQSSNLNGGGSQSIGLRNLGSDRVLVLVNGKRLARFSDSLQNEATDLSFIPLAMVDRIEVLRDGASTTYGADAVTGVVNVILKDDFEGMQVTGQGGISGEGDMESVSIQGVMGANFDRGNVTVSAEYNFNDNVPQTEREWAIPTITNGSLTANGSFFHPGGTVFFDDGNVFCTTPKVLGGDEVTDTTATTCPNNFNLLADGKYDYALVQDLINQYEAINIAGYATFDIDEDLEAFLEFQFGDRHSESTLDGNPGIFFISGDNPYNPYPGVDASSYIRPTSTVGARETDIDAQSIRVAFGLRGENLFDMFDWELSYLHNGVDSNSTTDSVWNLARLEKISDPTACAADPICTAALNPAGLGALDAYRPGNWSASEIAYFSYIQTYSSKYDIDAINANASADLFELPAGFVSIAFGAEYREESAEFTPDATTASGESIANASTPTRGKFDVSEVYAEIQLPLLADLPLVEELSLNIQGRAFDYSNFGDDTVYKFGAIYRPVEDVTFRATYGTSFRAPTVTESYGGAVESFDFLDDPCNDWDTSTNPNIVANCGAEGLVAGFTQTAAQIKVTAGGDFADGILELGPETSDSYTFGVSMAPSFIPGLQIAADYWGLTVDSYITTTDLQALLDACYEDGDASACSQFTRDSTGQLTGLVREPINGEGALETEGLDWSVAYAFEALGGAFSIRHQGTYLVDYNVSPGVGNCEDSDAVCIPEIRANLSTEYTIGDWSFEWRMRYIDSLDHIDFDGNNVRGFDGVEYELEHDARVTVALSEGVEFLVGVNNVFDEEAPYVFDTGSNTDTGLYGSAIIGRYFFGRVTADF